YIPRRLPAGVFGFGLFLAASTALAAVVWWCSAAGWRPSVAAVSYTPYLALMSPLWGMLFAPSRAGVSFAILLPPRLARRGRPGGCPPPAAGCSATRTRPTPCR